MPESFWCYCLRSLHKQYAFMANNNHQSSKGSILLWKEQWIYTILWCLMILISSSLSEWTTAPHHLLPMIAFLNLTFNTTLWKSEVYLFLVVRIWRTQLLSKWAELSNVPHIVSNTIQDCCCCLTHSWNVHVFFSSPLEGIACFCQETSGFGRPRHPLSIGGRLILQEQTSLVCVLHLRDPAGGGLMWGKGSGRTRTCYTLRQAL